MPSIGRQPHTVAGCGGRKRSNFCGVPVIQFAAPSPVDWLDNTIDEIESHIDADTTPNYGARRYLETLLAAQRSETGSNFQVLQPPLRRITLISLHLTAGSSRLTNLHEWLSIGDEGAQVKHGAHNLMTKPMSAACPLLFQQGGRKNRGLCDENGWRTNEQTSIFQLFNNVH
ncbi:hypothetical protein JTE90_029470 [Oedothorax gibbosus]|uniref:Uncharacterized protein n=1 Tax=Oedothorax gibbosus TaxID=931172 RepID=A0AAV6V4L5_9ARAC|nr:hypothetical protein JTE90_029470 [Oedothorax gibbosus]